jgi:hypothetical protein
VLCKTFARVEIAGKRGRTVPILFTSSIQRSIDFLIKTRKDVVDMTDLARKRSRTFTTLCVNVDFKDNPDRNKRNRLLEFDTDSTWMEVLEDTLEEGNVDVGIRKTNTVTVNLTEHMGYIIRTRSFTTAGALAAPIKTSNADTETGPVGLAMFEFMSLFSNDDTLNVTYLNVLSKHKAASMASSRER